MSDFLTRLAERALGVAASADPWIPPRYAQGPDLLETSSGGPAARGAERVEPSATWQRLLEPVPARSAQAAEPPPQPGTVRFLAPPRPRLVQPAPPKPADSSPVSRTEPAPPPTETVQLSPSSDLERYVKRARGS
jgi:hypothetical protein